MHKSLAFGLALACGGALAQTPATNLMPDGSRDMYIGLGANSGPRYDGASERRTTALPVLQVQWSNGIFISGMTAGMQLSNDAAMEYGPLFGVHGRRTQSGTSPGFGGVLDTADAASLVPPLAGKTTIYTNRLAGMDDIEARLLAGGFFNYYLAPRVRLTNSALYGAGNDHKGLSWVTDLQYSANAAPHHTLALSGGVTLVNQAYNQAFFGVTAQETLHGPNRFYTPSGGLKDVHAGVRWNWTFSPSWMLTSSLRVARLAGDAKDSPLVERPTNVTVSTALAYRF